MPRLLFLVHGMGRYQAGWSTEITDLLAEELAAYVGPAAAADRMSGLTVHELSYDSVFASYVDGWRRDRAALAEWSQKTGVALPGTLSTLARGLPGDEEDFVWDVALDPVLYRGLKRVRDDAVSLVLERITTLWAEALDAPGRLEDVEVTILCHSQGTMVMSDALALLGSGQWSAHGGLGFTAQERCVDTLVTLANVSQLAPSTFTPPLMDSRASCVRPRTAPAWQSGMQNYVGRLIVARHALDPFVLWRAFEPPAAWGADARLLRIDHVHQANTHGYTHYLKHPLVHVALFRALFGDPDVVSAAQEAQAIAAFPKFHPPECNAAIRALKTRLTALAAQRPATLDELATNALAFYQAAKEARHACATLAFGL